MNSFQLNDSTPYSIIYNQHNLITAHPTVNTLDRNATKCNEAEVLNSFFKSVFTVEDTSQLPEPQGMKVDQVLSTVEITPLIVKNKLLKLNKSKSTGPDLIHPWVLSETAGSICIPLAMIFTKSMEQGIVP